MNQKSLDQDTTISVLLPTRGRTESLRRSLHSLVDLADHPEKIELLLAFDDDDAESAQWFENNIAPHLHAQGSRYTAFSFPRLGYLRLNEYLNSLAARSHGRWLFFWGDDGIMHTQGWDSRVDEVTQFRVVRIPTHNQHPYAIFPIVPRAWFEMFGYLSPHQLTDSWVSQIAYMLDIMHDIDVSVTHDRFDITGNNHDDTYHNRPMLEGRPQDPRDFNHVSWRQRRETDAKKIYQHLCDIGDDGSWFGEVLAGRQDPWSKMLSAEKDPNRQMQRMS